MISFIQKRLVKYAFQIDLILNNLTPPKRRKQKKEKDISDSRLLIIYRISDTGYPKQKPHYINNENCFRNAILTFPPNLCKWHIIADNVSDETMRMLTKYVPENFIRKVSVGHGAGTFRLAYEYALQQPDDIYVYFLENDYLHATNALQILKEGLQLGESEYVTLYDHPDKYGYNNINPFVHGGEKTKIFLSNHCHWKITNSTTMTFSASVRTLRKDKSVFLRWTATRHPFDFQIFYELCKFRNRKLLSSIPGYSTHGETMYLSPLTDWGESINPRP